MTQPHHGKSEFIAYLDHTPPPAGDAHIFAAAADAFDEGMALGTVIYAAGGTQRHVNHVSTHLRIHGPASAWADRQDVEQVKMTLREIAAAMGGDHD